MLRALSFAAAMVTCAIAHAQVPYGPYGIVAFGGGGGGGISPPAGQIGGTTGSPTILGIRETSGPTNLTMAGVADGQCLARSGTTIAGTACGSGSGITQLTGPVTAGPGSGSQATTIATNAITTTHITDANVTLAKLASIAAATILGNNTGAGAAPIALTVTQVTAMLNLATTSVKGLIPALSNSATQYLDGTGNWSTPAGGGSSALWSKDYMADQMLPVGASWPTTAMADLETYNLVNVIAYDPTTSQGRGLEIVLPTGATTIDLTIDAAAAASGFTSNNGIVMALDCRQQYGTGSFTQQAATGVTLTDNATIQRKTFSYTVSGLSATAGTVLLCELERLTANGSDTMTQDWRVAHVGVVVN